MNRIKTSSPEQLIASRSCLWLVFVICAGLLLSGCSEEIAEHPIDCSTLIEHEFPQQHLNGIDSIYDRVYMHSSGEYLYLASFRKKEDYTNLWDLKFYDIKTGELETLADLGSDYVFHFELDDRLYTTLPAAGNDLRQLKCFEKKESVAPLGNWIFDEIYQMNGNLLIEDGRKIGCYVNGKEVGSLDVEPDFVSIEWTHPRQNVALLGYSRYNQITGKVDTKYPRSYYLVTFDDSFNILGKKRILQETETVIYRQFLLGRENELLYTKRIDTNGDGVADYMDRRNANIRSIDLKTLEDSLVFGELMDLGYLQGHTNGRIFFYELTRKGIGRLWFLDRSSKAKHVIMNLGVGPFRSFALDKDWSKLVYLELTDSNSDGKNYYWEDMSEVHLVDLQGLMENKL